MRLTRLTDYSYTAQTRFVPYHEAQRKFAICYKIHNEIIKLQLVVHFLLMVFNILSVILIVITVIEVSTISSLLDTFQFQLFSGYCVVKLGVGIKIIS